MNVMIMVMIENMMRRRIDEIIFWFMGRRIWIMIGILGNDIVMIGIILE